MANFDIAVGMNYGRVAGVKLAIAHRLRGGFRIVVIAFHHDVATHHDLAHRGAVSRDFRAGFVDDDGLARSNQLDSLPGFDDSALGNGKLLVLGSRLADSYERSCFS